MTFNVIYIYNAGAAGSGIKQKIMIQVSLIQTLIFLGIIFFVRLIKFKSLKETIKQDQDFLLGILLAILGLWITSYLNLTYT